MIQMIINKVFFIFLFFLSFIFFLIFFFFYFLAEYEEGVQTNAECAFSLMLGIQETLKVLLFVFFSFLSLPPSPLYPFPFASYPFSVQLLPFSFQFSFISWNTQWWQVLCHGFPLLVIPLLPLSPRSCSFTHSSFLNIPSFIKFNLMDNMKIINFTFFFIGTTNQSINQSTFLCMCVCVNG